MYCVVTDRSWLRQSLCARHFAVQVYAQPPPTPAVAVASSALPAGQLNAGATPLPQPAAAPSNAQTMTVDLPVHLYGRDDPVRKKCRVKKYWYSLGTSTTARVAGFDRISSSQPELYAAAFDQLKQWFKS